MTPRDVQAPDGALAWLEGSGRMPSRWLYAEDQVATLRTLGAYVLSVREMDGRRVVPGIMGYVDAAEFMALAGRLDAMEARMAADAERRDLALDEPVQRATR